MVCKNALCLFQHKNTCLAEPPVIDERGVCGTCLQYIPERDDLDEIKKDFRAHFDFGYKTD